MRAREITDLLKLKKQMTRRGQVRVQVYPTRKPLLLLLLRRKKSTNWEEKIWGQRCWERKETKELVGVGVGKEKKLELGSVCI